MVTVIPTDAHSSPMRPSDPFVRTMSTKLFKQVNNSTAPPTSMPPVPGMFYLSSFELVAFITFYLSVDTDVPMREWFARNASANESSLSLFKQSLKTPLGMSNAVSFPQCFI
jgi:hypothetical protein